MCRRLKPAPCQKKHLDASLKAGSTRKLYPKAPESDFFGRSNVGATGWGRQGMCRWLKPAREEQQTAYRHD
jgi:hypothetical protein